MYSNVKRNSEYINRLCDYIHREYQITPTAITPAKRGFYGETWRLDSAEGTNYFLKLVYPDLHKPVYERSFPIIQHLCDHGIDFISRIVKTKDGKLSTQFDGAVLGVFDWIDGENIETDATKIPEYQMLAKVYTVSAHGISAPCEDFSGKIADKFFEQWNASNDGQTLLLFEKNRGKIEHRAERLKKFAEVCRNDTAGFVITHGDAGGNFIANGGKYFIVDWDNPILAPPERDAWVMCCRDWARDAFQNAMRQNGIIYTLRPERLAYYCYEFFIFYLTAFLDVSTQAETIEEYFNHWIEESFRYADEIE
ncbi:MAG: aminoglycoside phosphotransferase family protein [Oscillospiraceae bacterium]|nr:aminoglycoside phosphotransferase family protein [Oscillospiraceae bacterium]